jgi:hypothetical protein
MRRHLDLFRVTRQDRRATVRLCGDGHGSRSEGLVVNGYQVAYHHPTGSTVLILTVPQHPNQVFMIPGDLAEELGAAVATAKTDALKKLS